MPIVESDTPAPDAQIAQTRTPAQQSSLDARLVTAAATGRKKAAVAAMRAGADIRCQRDAPIACAAKYGHPHMVEMLARHGAGYGSTLGWCGRHGKIEIFEALLLGGADVNFAGGIALRNAADAGQVAMIDRLFDAGAEFTVHGFAPLHAAASRGHQDATKRIIERSTKAARGRASHGTNTTAGAGISPGFREAFGKALIRAAKKGHADMMDCLLTAGADGATTQPATQHPLLRKVDMDAAMRAAVAKGATDAVALLLRNGASIGPYGVIGDGEGDGLMAHDIALEHDRTLILSMLNAHMAQQNLKASTRLYSAPAPVNGAKPNAPAPHVAAKHVSDRAMSVA